MILLTPQGNKSGIPSLEIIFKSEKLRKQCNSLAKAKRAWGEVRGRRIIRRLDEMRDADNLAILKTLPAAQCHLLLGERAGQWAVNLEYPYRLVFTPANEPLPRLPDGGLDPSQVTFVRILEVEDYHGKRAKK